MSYVRASPTIDAIASHLQTPAFSPEFSLSDYVHPYSLTFALHWIESQQHGRSLPGSLHRLDDTRKDGAFTSAAAWESDSGTEGMRTSEISAQKAGGWPQTALHGDSHGEVETHCRGSVLPADVKVKST